VDYAALKTYVTDKISNTHWQTTFDGAVDTCQTAVEAGKGYVVEF
jgi:hypothetical protein